MPTIVVENEDQEEVQQEQHEEQTEVKDEAEAKIEEHQEEPDEVVVTIGEQKPEEEDQQESAPQWVKDLRKNHRELQKKNRELEEKLKATTIKDDGAPQVGNKPTLEACGYDEDKFESELTAWYERKRKADEHTNKIEEDKRKQEEIWKSKLDGYAKAKTELKVKDFEDAESLAQELLDQTQQGIIVHGAKNPALMIYAIGKNPAKAKELAAIKDPVQFAIAIGELGKEIVMKPRKAPPAAEAKVTGSGSLAGATDGTLEQLRAQAEKSGDYSKVIAYKNQLRNKKQ